jgi:hypothetical protein
MNAKSYRLGFLIIERDSTVHQKHLTYNTKYSFK